MKHHFRLILLALAVALLPLLSATADGLRSPVAKLELQEGDSIVFLGDSITHQCLYTQYVEDYFYTRFPHKRLKFHNSGVGGAKAWDALQRFDRDVAAYKPKYVTVLLGMNDGRYQPYNEEIFQTYYKDMTELIGRLQKTGATPILMTPTMFDARAARMGKRKRDPMSATLYNSVLTYYGTWLREVAVESGFGFVDMYGPLNNLTLEQRKTDANFTMIRDAVHPDPPGQLVMAFAILQDMGLPRPVSNIRIVVGGKSGAQAVGKSGGKIANLKATDNGVEFTWTADSLPFVVPEEAQLGAKLVKLGHKMSREALEVHGLSAGRYQLSIDGEAVGSFSNVQLARHIELQENAKTPQHQQAAQVAELNKQRNAGPVRSLRNEWRTFQQFARSKAQLADAFRNEKLAKQVADLEKRLKGIDERIEQHEKAAKEIEDKIFEVNQPKPRRYSLKRVSTAKVTGRVTLDGQPLAGARIRFFETQRSAAGGKTDATGAFAIKSAGTAGVFPGTYRVVIGGQDLPARYSSAKQSALRVEVRAGENEFNFDLTGR